DSRDDAQTALDHAKAHGYPESWIFSRQADAVTAAPSADASAMARLDSDPGTGQGGNPQGDTSTTQPPVAVPPQPTLQDLLKQVKELPTEVPPGYHLNQLYRDGEPANTQQ